MAERYSVPARTSCLQSLLGYLRDQHGQIRSFCFKLNLDEVAIFKEQFPITNQLNALGNLFEEVLFMIAAHNKMASRNEAVMAILREMVAAEGSGMSCMHLGREVSLEVRDGKTSWKIYRRRSLHSIWLLWIMKPSDKGRIGWFHVILHVDPQNPNIDPRFRDDTLLIPAFFSIISPKVCARHARRGDGWWSSSKDLRD